MSAPARILIAQGPVQLLAALAGWSCRRHTDAKRTEDVLVLGGYCTSREGALELDRSCEQIASLWPFQKITKVSDLDAKYDTAEMPFEGYREELARRLPKKIAEIWACRNMQAINEAILGSFPRALKICYGDGLGAIDLNGTAWCRPLGAQGYPQVDAICATFPIEFTENIFSKMPVEIVPLSHFVTLVKASARKLTELQDLAASFNAPQPHRTLVLATNGTEAGIFPDIERELEFYLSAIAESVPRDSEIIVKGHPRQRFSQSQRVVDALKASGRSAKILNLPSSVIVEFWATALPFNLVCTLFSSAGPAWRAIQPDSDIICGVDPTLRKRFVSPGADAMYSLETMNAMAYAQMAMAASPNAKCLRMAAIKELAHLAPTGPILFKAREHLDISNDPFLTKVFASALPSTPVKTSLWDRVLRRFQPS